MRVYHNRAIRRYTGGVWVVVAPDVTPTVSTYTVAGALVEGPLTASYDATRQRWYFDTTAALYATYTLYYATWTVLLSGVTYNPVDWFVSVSTSTTMPAAPGIGTPAPSDTSVSFPVTPTPATTTVIYCFTPSGVLTGTGTGTSIVVSGLSPGSPYSWYGEAVSSSGVRSNPVFGNWGTFWTLPGAMPSDPYALKWWFSNRTGMSGHAPVYGSVARKGQFTVGTIAAPLGRGTNIRFRIECHAPVWPKFAGVRFHITTRPDEPRGLQDRLRHAGE